MLTPPKALILAKNYTPVSVFPHLSTMPGEEAIHKLLSDKLEVIEYYDRPILSNFKPIESKEQGILYWPAVVVDIKSKIRKSIKTSIEVLHLRERGRCFWCDTPISLGNATKDHVVPQSKGGDNSFENLVCACVKCNTEKGDSMPEGKWKVTKLIRKPTFHELAEFKFREPTPVPSVWIPYLPEFFNAVPFEEKKPLAAE